MSTARWTHRPGCWSQVVLWIALLAAPLSGQPQGGALSFESGENEFVRIPAHETMDSGVFTLELWVKRQSSLLDQQCVVFRNAAGVGMANGLVLTYGYMGRNAWTVFVGGKPMTGRTSQPLGRWSHLAVVYDGKHVNFYIDGRRELREEDTEDLKWDGDLFLGVELDSKDGDMDGEQSHGGLIDEVRLWSVARTPEQIRASMKGVAPPDPRFLAGCWGFGEVGGAIIYDGSGNENHGVMGQIPSGARNGTRILMPRRVWIGKKGEMDLADSPTTTGFRGCRECQRTSRHSVDLCHTCGEPAPRPHR